MTQNELNPERWGAFTDEEKAHIATASTVLVRMILDDPEASSDFKRTTLVTSAQIVNECAATAGVGQINEGLLKAALDRI